MNQKYTNQLRAILFGLAVSLILPACRTCQGKAVDADEATVSSDAVRDVLRKMHEIVIPEMTPVSEGGDLSDGTMD